MLFRGDICPRTYVRDVLEWHGKTGAPQRADRKQQNKIINKPTSYNAYNSTIS